MKNKYNSIKKFKLRVAKKMLNELVAAFDLYIDEIPNKSIEEIQKDIRKISFEWKKEMEELTYK